MDDEVPLVLAQLNLPPLLVLKPIDLLPDMLLKEERLDFQQQLVDGCRFALPLESRALSNTDVLRFLFVADLAELPLVLPCPMEMHQFVGGVLEGVSQDVGWVRNTFLIPDIVFVENFDHFKLVLF